MIFQLDMLANTNKSHRTLFIDDSKSDFIQNDQKFAYSIDDTIDQSSMHAQVSRIRLFHHLLSSIKFSHSGAASKWSQQS